MATEDMAHTSKTGLTVVTDPVHLSHTMSDPSFEQQTLVPLIKKI